MIETVEKGKARHHDQRRNEEPFAYFDDFHVLIYSTTTFGGTPTAWAAIAGLRPGPDAPSAGPRADDSGGIIELDSFLETRL